MHSETAAPRISVIIPAYCDGDMLRRCLRSVQAQTFNSYEVIVCDDGSPEDLAQTVREMSEDRPIQYVRIANSGGAAAPRNAAAARARGEWLAFLDADDTWHAEKLSSLAPYLDESCDVVYHRLAIHSDARRVFRPKPIGNEDLSPTDTPFDLLSLGNPIPTSSAVVRRSLFEQLEGMSTDLALVEDYDFWIRAAWRSARFRRVPAVLGEYYVTPGSQSSPKLTYVRQLHTTIRQNLDYFAGVRRQQVESYMEFSVGVQFLWAHLYKDAEQHLKSAAHLRSPRQRCSRRAKLLKIRAKMLYSAKS